VTERIYLSPPHVGDEERTALLETFDSNWVTSEGVHITGFEQDMVDKLGSRRAVAVSSGTAALHLCLKVLGIGPGDVVMVPSLTFAATSNVVDYVGGRTLLVDSDADTWTIDPYLVIDEIKRRAGTPDAVRALMPVDIYGQCCDYDELLAVCAEHDVVVVEDAAEALGSTYRGKAAGTFGDAGVISFNGNKILTSGSGGMIVTDDDELADRVRFLSTQAREPAVHYEHSEVGFNYRMNNMLAAMGRAQLARLDDRVAAKRAVFARYSAAFADVDGITMMPQAAYGTSNCWLTCILVDADRFGASSADIMNALAALDIESRPTWKPMHLQPVHARTEMVGGDVSADLFRRGLCLPSGSALTDDQLQRVIDAVLATPAGRS
jgi:dTDP-4-amino-4,6-dideoxygalactose transaminase